MALASWVGTKAEQRKAAEEAAEIFIDSVPDSIETATGWRVIFDDFWTLVPPVGGPVHDETVIRAIRSFDPTVIPMYRKQVYLPPGSMERRVFSHLAFGRHVRSPRREMALFRVETGPNHKGPVPNELLMIWEFFDARYLYEGGPGGVFPSDMRIYQQMRKDFLRGDQKSSAWLAGKEQAWAKAREARRKGYADDIAYKQKHLDAYVTRKLETPGDNVKAFRDWKYLQRNGRSPRPFVHLKGV